KSATPNSACRYVSPYWKNSPMPPNPSVSRSRWEYRQPLQLPEAAMGFDGRVERLHGVQPNHETGRHRLGTRSIGLIHGSDIVEAFDQSFRDGCSTVRSVDLAVPAFLGNH